MLYHLVCVVEYDLTLVYLNGMKSCIIMESRAWEMSWQQCMTRGLKVSLPTRLLIEYLRDTL